MKERRWVAFVIVKGGIKRYFVPARLKVLHVAMSFATAALDATSMIRRQRSRLSVGVRGFIVSYERHKGP